MALADSSALRAQHSAQSAARAVGCGLLRCCGALRAAACCCDAAAAWLGDTQHWAPDARWALGCGLRAGSELRALRLLAEII
jgi:hypothetical protein